MQEEKIKYKLYDKGFRLSTKVKIRTEVVASSVAENLVLSYMLFTIHIVMRLMYLTLNIPRQSHLSRLNHRSITAYITRIPCSRVELLLIRSESHNRAFIVSESQRYITYLSIIRENVKVKPTFLVNFSSLVQNEGPIRVELQRVTQSVL